ncbi:DUF6779 domain-containing protein [Antrihabitans cavernicola]|uniref:DUF6779 domain-containing protein n=1 Tax=Antrihabitans cavernicola TaxID=2495913 RepID=A0A5A7SBU1_9NOCA|nr:DUF6779 domain-containing protein [Spelaeibacter cavernicola]KAA0022063.1 hypothetical protein FOY51_16950 [Spelaeibacter cavernicola]
MTFDARTKSPRRGRRSAGQYFIGAIIALALTASVVSLFFDSARLLRIGVVIAVWAALLGAFAMHKYRRDAAIDQAKARDLQTVYELQLEREISARREFELGVESRVRDELRPDAHELAGLRSELASLRNSLEMLFDGKLPVDRVALRADSTRVQELASGPYSSYQPAPSGLFVPDNGSPRFATPYDAPVTAETSIVPPDLGVPVVPEPAVQPESEPAQPEPVAAPEPVIAATVEPEPEPEPVILPEAAAGSRRRRRADSDDAANADRSKGGHSSGGRTVAEIMAGLQSESAAQSAGGGRRRSAD